MRAAAGDAKIVALFAGPAAQNEPRPHRKTITILHGRNVAILAHAFTKEGKVSDADIDLAMARQSLVRKDPGTHIQEE